MSEDTNDLIEELKRGYVCPPDAGPAWRAAMGAGCDMSLIECALEQSPEERLAEHQQVIDFLCSIRGKAASDAAE